VVATIPIEVHGFCDPRFAGVAQAFLVNFLEQGEVGASVAVTIDGRPVVDLWGGHADAARQIPWKRESIVTVYSATKGPAALCAHICADRGLIDFEAPVSRYWPEFGQNGKDNVLVRHVLTHTAGIPAIKEALPREALFDRPRMVAALERAPLWFEPGSAMGYHSVTYGFLVGELVRRVSGRTLGTFLRDEVAVPLGVEFHIGFGPELDPLVAELIPAPPETDNLAQHAANPESLHGKTYHNPPAHNSDRSIPNTRAWRAAEIPSVNGHGNARGLARMYAALACGGTLDGVRILSPESVVRAGTVAVEMDDMVFGGRVARCLGFTPIAGHPGAFGHSGQGGSIGFADPAMRMSMAYVPNQMRFGQELRRPALIEATYASLSAQAAT